MAALDVSEHSTFVDITQEESAPISRSASPQPDGESTLSLVPVTNENALIPTEGAEGKKLKKIIRKKKRPAPPQVDPATFKSCLFIHI